ncbi:RidA family protein [Jiangella alba]|uniref:Enamine deaminase RidA, house cleaning of reactive enamine intermediates, YjgF/YER057c/UK114 family n=1 Tax=Jiangella alba TaxID=561176 RepID=A0A1H5PWS1_9ACTN|nr:RidA family protein [Jiangella alba]SEF18293.1 Enamine deaminase RidA, house cleaning of reactive enamine intermediates, YjgF/YER057c/UK114 family [Jiangella alba]
MPMQLINPPGLPQPPTYSQVVVATGSRQVVVAGQVPCDATGALVGAGDLAAQTEQTLRNVATALAAAGATFADVVRLGIFVAGYDEHSLEQVHAGLVAASDVAVRPDGPPAATLVGVAALAFPGQLIEIEATAVLP